MQVSSLSASWLVRLLSNDLPDVVDVDLDHNAVIDLLKAIYHFGIYTYPDWQDRLLASRVESQPGKCLEKTLNVGSLDIDLAVSVISLLPHSLLSTLNDKIALINPRPPPANLDWAMSELAMQPLPRWTAHRTIGEHVILQTGPSLALVLAVAMAREEDPRTTQEAVAGCMLAQKQLARTVAVDFAICWPKVQRLAVSASWMTVDA